MFKTLDEFFASDRTTGSMAWRSLICWAGGVVIAVVQFEAVYTALLELD
jgi:Trk-type K+ transport system membrane component